MRQTLIALFIIHLSSFILTGCGYKPTSHYTREITGGSISTHIVISMQDPENTVLLKDALNEAVVNRFRSRLTDRAHAKTHLTIALRNTVFEPIRYDTNGFVVAYRARITLDIDRETEGATRRYTTEGSHQFAIEPNAIISDYVRFQAIQAGAEKALDSFVAKVAAEGIAPR